MSEDPAIHILDELRIEDLEVLKLVFDPQRMRILEAFAGPPRSVKQVAEDLGTTTHRLYYHVNLLEEHGLLIVAETHIVSGIVEKLYQVAARHFIVAPSLITFGESGSAEGLDILLHSILEETRQDIHRSARRQIIDLTKKAPDPTALLIRRGLSRMTPARASEFYSRLLALLAEFTAADEEGKATDAPMMALTLGFYPTSQMEDDQPDAES